jgi:sugar/nucleoside kinase (ribokinase family)
MTLDLLATGYPSLDYICQVSHSPAVGETAIVRTPPSRYTFGGCGANVAVGLARLGFRAGVAMVVGDDAPGRDYVAYLQRKGIDTREVIRWPDVGTSESRLYVNPEGEYQNFFYAGAADAWQGKLTLTSLAEARYALLTVGALHYNRQFVQLVLKAGIPLIWQLKPDVYAYPPEALTDLTRSSALLMMNRIEADYLIRTLGVSSAADLLSDETRLVVVTHGADGSRIFDQTGIHKVPAVPPAQLVDPTGAGDAFTTGFLAGWLQGRSPVICGRLGAVVASFALEKVGCQTNLPNWEMLSARYTEHFSKANHPSTGSGHRLRKPCPEQSLP